MKFSEQWLREWVNPDIDTDALVHQVTMAGLEVDGVEPVAADFSGVIVGEILSAEQHPDADKLRVCQVSNGSDTFQVVCGAPNARAGIKIPFAEVGAVLPGNFKIKKAKLRGVESFGMLCAESELGLAENSEGLMELAGDAPVGENIRTYLDLDDQCIEVDLTPNRSDCLSIAGLAREVGVLNKVNLTPPDESKVEALISDTFPVSVEAPNACPKYLGRVIKGVNIDAETPLWMKEKLRRCGLRSIDPAVDVTNYILLEFGQPMHAFDLQRLQGSVIVRNAKAEERLTLLDGQEIALRDDTLVIADEGGPLAIAGIMGGEASGVSAETQDVFLECAYFNPIAIAGKARSYGLHTDSSHRFERGVDYQLQQKAMERATALLIQIMGGQAGPIVETKDDSELPKDRQVTLRRAKLSSLLGVDIEPAEVEEILTRLGLNLASQDDASWTFDVPSYRFDISIEQDLVEEVGRIYGYNNLPKTLPSGAMKLTPDDEATRDTSSIVNQLVNLGYQEAITYSFVDAKIQDQVNPGVESIALANPISSDMSVMRTSLWTGLLQAVCYNQNRQQSRIKLFETGLKFEKIDDEIVQTPMISGVISGQVDAENWCNTKRKVDFFDIKSDLESVLSGMGDTLRFEKSEHEALHPGQTAKIFNGNKLLGFVGGIHPKLQKNLDLNGPLYMFELFLNEVVQGQVASFSEVSKYPEVRRDLAIVIDRSIPYAHIETTVKENAGADLSELKVFDVFSGGNLADTECSVGLGLIWQRVDRTLNDEEINTVFDAIVTALSTKYGARLRS